MKNFIKILIFCTSCIFFIFPLTSCGKEKRITDFPQYKDLTRTPAKIIIEYEDAYIGTYEITDSETIEEITTILFDETTFEKAKNGFFAGNNSVMTLVDESGEETSISLKCIKYRSSWYLYTNGELLTKVGQIGFEMGALEPH